MSLIIYKLLAALIIFCTSIIIIYYPLKKKRTMGVSETAELGEALASGIFFGAAFFHLLPDGINVFRDIFNHNTIYAESICVFGFMFLLFLERLSLNFSAIAVKNVIPMMLVLMLTIHALTEGAALGIGSVSETTMLFIAIVAHKSTETFVLCVTLLRHQLPIKKILYYVIFFSLMTPLGIVFGTGIDLFSYAKDGKLFAAGFNAFAAGSFLYISTLHHIHFHKHGKDTRGLLEYLFTLFGVTAMGILAIFAV